MFFEPWHINDPCRMKPSDIESQKYTQKPAKHLWRVFSTEPCVTLVYSELEAYLEPFQISMMENFIQNPRHIQNTGKHLWRNILFKTLCNHDIFRTLVNSELWHILKSKHIQNPAEYLTWSFLLRTLSNYRRIRRPIYSELSHVQNRCMSATH